MEADKDVMILTDAKSIKNAVDAALIAERKKIGAWLKDNVKGVTITLKPNGSIYEWDAFILRLERGESIEGEK